MAVQWLEKNQTDITSNQWAETIYGVKATNVFGLAWNYYTAYTKFITGLDITLDLGGKCEFVFGATIKIGYANELATWGDVKTGLNKKKVEIAAAAQTLVASSEEAIDTRTTFSESVAESLGSRISILSDDSTERDTYFSTTAGDEVLVAGTVSQTADSIEVTAALEHIITTALFNVNDSLEVL